MATQIAHGENLTTLFDAFKDAAESLAQYPEVDDLLTQTEGARYLIRMIAAGALLQLENHDPAHPLLSRFITAWTPWGLPNPDYGYLYAPLHGDYRYRLFGRRGTAHMLAVETSAGDWSSLASIKVVESKADFRNGESELNLGPGGEIDINLSQDAQSGNWMQISPGRGSLLIREGFYDWDTESPSMLFIERVGATYPQAAPTSNDLTENLQFLGEFVRDGVSRMAKAAAQHFVHGPETIQFPPPRLGDNPDRDDAGFRNQAYGQGHYRCDRDQAVILEVKPPQCAYWGFHLANLFWEACDWHVRPTSINGHQAVLDDDGFFRAVIAHQDPGVPNWLDAGNAVTGLIGARYTRADSVPIPALKVVPAGEVRSHLPTNTPMVSPAERAETQRRRTFAFARRRVD